jgi:hypothetical protein
LGFCITGTYLAHRHALCLTNTLFIVRWHWKWKHYILNAAFYITFSARIQL